MDAIEGAGCSKVAEHARHDRGACELDAGDAKALASGRLIARQAASPGLLASLGSLVISSRGRVLVLKCRAPRPAPRDALAPRVLRDSRGLV